MSKRENDIEKDSFSTEPIMVEKFEDFNLVIEALPEKETNPPTKQPGAFDPTNFHDENPLEFDEGENHITEESDNTENISEKAVKKEKLNIADEVDEIFEKYGFEAILNELNEADKNEEKVPIDQVEKLFLKEGGEPVKSQASEEGPEANLQSTPKEDADIDTCKETTRPKESEDVATNIVQEEQKEPLMPVTQTEEPVIPTIVKEEPNLTVEKKTPKTPDKMPVSDTCETDGNEEWQTTMPIIIQTKNLFKKYKSKYAVENLNITIRKGDIYGLIGVNGAGKSTLIKTIMGITAPTSGTVELFGDENDLNAKREMIGSIIENPTFNPNMTAEQILKYYCVLKNIKDKDLPEKLLKQVNLEFAQYQKFKFFSLGMKQRLGIAFALMNNPKLVILDEPTNGLDPVGIASLRDIIKQLNKEGVTFLICSHVLSELSQIATKYGIMHEGKFLKEFTNEELQEQCREKIIFSTKNKQETVRFFAEQNYEYIVRGENQYELALKEELDSVLRKLVEYNVNVTEIVQIKTSLEDTFFETISNVGGVK